MKVEIVPHKLANLNLPFPFRQIIGNDHYIFSSEKGAISMIFLPNFLSPGVDMWEIYCLKGKLFEDIERFYSKTEAENKIRDYLLTEDEKNRKRFIRL